MSQAQPTLLQGNASSWLGMCSALTTNFKTQRGRQERAARLTEDRRRNRSRETGMLWVCHEKSVPQAFGVCSVEASSVLWPWGFCLHTPRLCRGQRKNSANPRWAVWAENPSSFPGSHHSRSQIPCQHPKPFLHLLWAYMFLGAHVKARKRGVLELTEKPKVAFPWGEEAGRQSEL